MGLLWHRITASLVLPHLPVELWGQAEAAAETLEPGDEVMMTGKLKYKSVVDAKTQAKVSKLIVSSWGISQRLPGKTSGPAEGGFYLTRGDRRAWTDW